MGKFSNALVLKRGLAQGSVLGPLLFLVYINDLPKDLLANAKLFVDDAYLFSIAPEINNSAIYLNDDLRKLVTGCSNRK